MVRLYEIKTIIESLYMNLVIVFLVEFISKLTTIGILEAELRLKIGLL
jgi:hypothetical protein